MSENPQPNPDNTTIRSLRDHITSLEQQLSTSNIQVHSTTTEKALIEEQKKTLEAELENTKNALAEQEAIKERALKLETRFQSLVEAELESFTDDQKESVKTIIAGLSPDDALDRLKALKAFTAPVVSSKPGDPPPPPRTSEFKPGDPPDPNQVSPEFKKVQDAIAKGIDPLSVLDLKLE